MVRKLNLVRLLPKMIWYSLLSLAVSDLLNNSIFDNKEMHKLMIIVKNCYESALVQQNCPSSNDVSIRNKLLILLIFTHFKNTSNHQSNIFNLIFNLCTVLLNLTYFINAELKVCRFLSINFSFIYCIYKSFVYKYYRIK